MAGPRIGKPPFAAGKGRENRGGNRRQLEPSLVDLDHVGEREKVVPVGNAHRLLHFSELGPAHFAHPHLNQLPVPDSHPEILGKQGLKAGLKFVFGGRIPNRLDDLGGLDSKMEAEETVESSGEIALIGFGKLAGEVLPDLGEETGQMEQAAAVRQVRRGEVAADRASRSEGLFLSHGRW